MLSVIFRTVISYSVSIKCAIKQVVELANCELLNKFDANISIIHVCQIQVCNLFNNKLSLVLANHNSFLSKQMCEVLIYTRVQIE